MNKLNKWIDEKVGLIEWYNKMIVIGLAYFVGVGIRYAIMHCW